MKLIQRHWNGVRNRELYSCSKLKHFVSRPRCTLLPSSPSPLCYLLPMHATVLTDNLRVNLTESRREFCLFDWSRSFVEGRISNSIYPTPEKDSITLPLYYEDSGSPSCT